MHPVLSRDGTDPSEFRRIATSQLEKYPSIQFQHSDVVETARKDVESGSLGFKVVDNEGNVFSGRKLIIATGSEDILPGNLPGYRENWHEHM